eukprot:COSAG06_NODE_1905_length_8095_cov_10.218984_11_plen_82_part_00
MLQPDWRGARGGGSAWRARSIKIVKSSVMLLFYSIPERKRPVSSPQAKSFVQSLRDIPKLPRIHGHGLTNALSSRSSVAVG